MWGSRLGLTRKRSKDNGRKEAGGKEARLLARSLDPPGTTGTGPALSQCFVYVDGLIDQIQPVIKYRRLAL